MWFGSAENLLLPSVTDLQNDGLIYFEQENVVASIVALALVIGSGRLLSPENNGQISGRSFLCSKLFNDGSGCINVEVSVTAHLLPDVSDAAFSIGSDQTIYLSSVSSRLLFLTGGLLEN